MKTILLFWRWLKSFGVHPAARREIDEELRFHLEQRTADNIAAGMTPAEAAREARKRFGNFQSFREECRHTRGVSFWETTLQDVRFALRMLRKNPGFAMVAILTLALGIGANTAIFSVADRLLARPLPVRAPERLALLGMGTPERLTFDDFNYPLVRDYQRGNTVFSELTAIGDCPVGLGDGGSTERQKAALVSGNYFTMLGVDAVLGRTFSPNEGVEIDDAPVLVLSHSLWRSRFGADPQVIGRAVTLNGKPFTIIGVAPREFTGALRGQSPDIYVPITMYGQLTSDRPGGENPLKTRYFTWVQIMGRLKDGVTFPQAQAAMDALSRGIFAVTPINTSTNVVVLPGAQGFAQNVREARLPLNLLLAIAALVLLIACANLTNLQLARATVRSREFAVRLALGAGRGRLIRQLLTESFILAVLGGSLGLLVAAWLANWLEKFQFSFQLPGGLDTRVLAFAFVTSVGAGIVFGLAPAWRASRPQLVPELKSEGGAAEPRGRVWNVRNALVVLQVSLSLLVLVSAGLCVRSLAKLQQLDAGFEPSRAVLMSFDLELNNYTSPQAVEFFGRLLERVRAFPGIEAASLASTTPLSGWSPGMSINRIEGYQPRPNDVPWADLDFISSDYFRTLGSPIIRGREFTPADTAVSPRVAVVNEAFVELYCAGRDPLGLRLYVFNGDEQHPGGIPVEVVGVVHDTRNRRLADNPRQAMFFPVTQNPTRTLTLVARTGVEPGATIKLLRGLVKSLDATVPVFQVRTLAEQKNGSLALQRLAAHLLGGFGLLALALAALGIYGVLAYSVSRRTREIGVRMALGAQIGDVLRLVILQGLGLVGLGLVLGLAGAFAVTRLLSSFLFEVKPLDAPTFLVVVMVLIVVALGACWLPARRAAKVHPMEALRCE